MILTAEHVAKLEVSLRRLAEVNRRIAEMSQPTTRGRLGTTHSPSNQHKEKQSWT